MGIKTSIAAISPTLAEKNAAAAIGVDLNGLLYSAQVKASQLTMQLNAISNALPNGDANIAAIAAIVTQLS